MINVEAHHVGASLLRMASAIDYIPGSRCRPVKINNIDLCQCDFFFCFVGDGGYEHNNNIIVICGERVGETNFVRTGAKVVSIH